ncbi:MAG: bifunctional diaminohydroxyphosphoribosylaminopyrimidine deaminase/5-amino-6-(5-phosphoribosylamino)uracil reductase RibD [Ekhidna sp.]|nr:bifunctional diaminohydroxyphosphoribosylaminopyrimidine deaminase/5-amino-6-(5-phosphoribosylamino)uracil reductase RibD [Ekhidna sp.]MBC6410683.1 bifunctional diaminohydroxyphosphoribosylaminopyrimidine deaminase/5-amino-6-(5-phosphoribosylamino)uracil reductase RibD [Ekhidna sp.]
MSDIQFMQRALKLAQLGRGSVSPHPMVGCVITYEDKIIGEGFHLRYGEAHAEVNAVNDVEDQSLLPDSTVYITLEPCAHYGKTPPCADLLIDKRVRKVVAACRDPFVQVDGKGIEKLKKAGIEVGQGLMEKEAIELNKRFFTFHQKKRPYVILKWAQTQDGFIARENGDSKWISNQYSRQLVHKWRTEEDAVLVGKNTAIQDNPSLTSRYWEGKNPLRVLFDSSLRVEENKAIFNSQAKTLIFNLTEEKMEKTNRWVKCDELKPEEVLKTLHKENIQSIIIEGGSQVLNAFVQDNCWDEARIFTSKVIFQRGIKPPEINGEITARENILEDQLTIYKNPLQNPPLSTKS